MLTRESFADAMRRRIVPVVIVVSMFSLMLIDSCTGCAPTLNVQGQETEIPSVSGWLGMAMFLVLGLWSMVLGGILAADHLISTLEDGSAHLVLARPIGRGTFAMTRIIGVLGITYITGSVLLLGESTMMSMRQDLDLAPAFAATLLWAMGAFIVACFSMTVSLWLPRIAVSMLVMVSVAGIGAVNIAKTAWPDLEGAGVAVIHSAGPPLASAMIAALAPWFGPIDGLISPTTAALRLGLWAVISAAALIVSFQRIELKA